MNKFLQIMCCVISVCGVSSVRASSEAPPSYDDSMGVAAAMEYRGATPGLASQIRPRRLFADDGPPDAVHTGHAKQEGVEVARDIAHASFGLPSSPPADNTYARKLFRKARNAVRFAASTKGEVGTQAAGPVNTSSLGPDFIKMVFELDKALTDHKGKKLSAYTKTTFREKYERVASLYQEVQQHGIKIPGRPMRFAERLQSRLLKKDIDVAPLGAAAPAPHSAPQKAHPVSHGTASTSGLLPPVLNLFKKHEGRLHELEQNYLSRRSYLTKSKIDGMIYELHAALYDAMLLNQPALVRAAKKSETMTKILQEVRQTWMGIGRIFLDILKVAEAQGGWDQRRAAALFLSQEFPLLDPDFHLSAVAGNQQMQPVSVPAPPPFQPEPGYRVGPPSPYRPAMV